ncbi:transmembrane protein, putative [Medicago truncatula]|uniref:Transmembrane protein, putative n=1 Tax=Medicago truncatula TaxID=3880 RepID=A0A072TZB8_MEDTR|nr:transmembrane protein, putative [Medicago truncatula]
MAKHISQYFLVGLLFIALALTLGPTPGLSSCFPSDCTEPRTSELTAAGSYFGS